MGRNTAESARRGLRTPAPRVVTDIVTGSFHLSSSARAPRGSPGGDLAATSHGPAHSREGPRLGVWEIRSRSGGASGGWPGDWALGAAVVPVYSDITANTLHSGVNGTDLQNKTLRP